MESEQAQAETTILTTSGEIVGERKLQIDHSYTEAVADLNDTEEHETEMKAQALNGAKVEADEDGPMSTVQNTEGEKVNHELTEQNETEPGGENANLNMEVWGEHDSKTESYKVIMCSDGIKRRGMYALS